MKFDYTFRLSSILDIAAAAAQPLPDYSARQDNAARNRPAKEWSGNVTYTQAIALAENGWTDAPKLGEIADRLTSSETRTSLEMKHAVSGSFVDMGRFVEGHPECMMEFAEEPAPKSIHLAVETGKGACATPREMELTGAVAMAVIDTLTKSGIRVEVSSFFAHKNKKSGKTALTIYPLKRAAEPIDENQLAFWLCHPAAFRSLIFGFWDACPYSFYRDMDQSDGRSGRTDTTPADLGVDYIIRCNPETEAMARVYYHDIIAEIQNTL